MIQVGQHSQPGTCAVQHALCSTCAVQHTRCNKCAVQHALCNTCAIYHALIIIIGTAENPKMPSQHHASAGTQSVSLQCKARHDLHARSKPPHALCNTFDIILYRHL
jgi:hypothetical protein